MHQHGNLKYAEDANVQVLEMQYEGGDLAMTFVLPRSRTDSRRRGRPRPGDVRSLAGAPARTEVNVAIPKFTIDPASSSRSATSSPRWACARVRPHAADLTASRCTGHRGAAVHQQGFHKAFVKVDERGTEAAAATAVVVASRAPPRPRAAKEFKADHPFLFFLRDLRSASSCSPPRR